MNDVTVVPEEIDLYKVTRAFWWITDQPTNLLYLMNEIRTPWIVNAISKQGLIDKKNRDTTHPLRGLSLLDVGCGGGYITEVFGKLGASVTGIDPSIDAIEAAKEHLARIPEISTISYSCESIENHSENNREKYDVIVALEMIHHVKKLELFIKLCLNCLKPGGLILISSYNKSWASWFLVMYLHYVKRVPYELVKWDSFRQPEVIAECLEKYHCKNLNVSGIRFNFLKRKWDWCHYFPSSFALYGVKQ